MITLHTVLLFIAMVSSIWSSTIVVIDVIWKQATHWLNLLWPAVSITMVLFLVGVLV